MSVRSGSIRRQKPADRGLSAVAVAALLALGASAATASTMFEDLDVDGDGALTREEMLAGAPDFNAAIFIFSDRNNDGLVTRSEFVRAQRRANQNELTD